jgi:glycosyltransferase involved in cell wall biosynthesis
VLLAEAGCDVLLIGTRILEGALTFPRHQRITVRRLSAEAAGWRQKAQYARFLVWAVAQAIRFKPHWIYVSDPLATPIAEALRFMTSASVIYHEHDSPSGESSSVAARFIAAARRQIARRAVICVLPSNTRARVFAQSMQRTDVLTVWNTPLAREVAPSRSPRRDTELRVLYHGSIVPERLPLTTLEAMARLPETVTLTVVGYDPAGGRYLSVLRQEVHRLGLAHRVRFAGTVPARADLLALAATCDVGLALMPTSSSSFNEQTMLGASNKPFDYLACGLPLLVTDLPDWCETYAVPGYARVCVPESVDSMTTELRWFLEHPNERAIMGEHGRQRVADGWNYESGFAPLLERIVGTVPMRGAHRVAGAEI